MRGALVAFKRRLPMMPPTILESRRDVMPLGSKENSVLSPGFVMFCRRTR